MFRLLRYFSIASAVALIAVTFASVYLYRDNAMEELVVSAEGQNITPARSFANILWPRFSHYVMTVAEGDGLRARPETTEIDEAVRTPTAGLPDVPAPPDHLKKKAALTIARSWLPVAASPLAQALEETSKGRG